MQRRQFLAGLAAGPLSASADRGLIAHWPLTTDARDASGHGRDGIARHVVFTAGGAEFDGRASVIEVPGAGALNFGASDFTIALWADAPAHPGDVAGDLAFRYDADARRGFTLNIKTNSVTTAQSNYRNLHFGIDQGRGGETWVDCGRPGASVFDMALAVHYGELYVGVCEPGPEQQGRVYRYAGASRWEDCGAPDLCNAVSALASWNGHLYAGTAKYRLAGSALNESENPHLGGKVFRYDGGSRWTDCGRLGQSPALGCLTTYRGQLYGSSLYAPAGVFRYAGGQQWAACGAPQGLRVEAMAVYQDQLFGAGYDKGQVYKYLGGRDWAIVGDLPGATQTYGFAVYQGRLYVSTWPGATVFRYERDGEWTPVGQPGDEKESMALAVYNGKMYVGTLPLAEVHRYEGGTRWTRLAQLDRTPEVKYRRAWSMAVFQGKLFCGTLPSGRVYAMEAGRNATYDHPWPAGWRHIAAVREGGRLRLYAGGRQVAVSTPFAPRDYDLSVRGPLLLGSGDHQPFRGRLRDIRLYSRALSAREITALAAQR